LLDPLAVMWGKSKAGGSMHLLIAHLFDTAAVAELIWDRYLAPGVRRELDRCTGGRGREFLALACAVHDVRKATPAFQGKVPELAAAVRSAGFDWPPQMNPQGWHHSMAGAVIVRDALAAAGWSARSRGWVWPLVAGHHGRVPGADRLEPKDRRTHGSGSWPAAQQAFVERVTAELGVDLREFADVEAPSRAIQLALSGLVIMADWLASNDAQFSGIARLDDVSMVAARSRALQAWGVLGLRGGWTTSALDAGGGDLVLRRFAEPARESQRHVMELAEQMHQPGLLVVEAPMGEGKTKAALAAAEILARKFGADGIFVGMPTQATSDPMFHQVRSWLAAIDAEVPIALLHGRSRFNKEWMQLRQSARFQEVGNEFGITDDYGAPRSGCSDRSGQAAAEWFLGRNRGLPNLTAQPWVPVTKQGVRTEVSVREALLQAHEFDGLAIDDPLQAVAVFRQVLLPVLLHVFGVPRDVNEWDDRHRAGRLDPAPVSAYLDEHASRFDLFNPDRPFAQVAGLAAVNGETKPVSLLIPHLASGNNVPLFSPRTENDPPALTPAQAARAVLSAQCWDTAAIKTGAVGDEKKVRAGKTMGNPTGPLGQLGVVIPLGDTLFETLMLSVPIVPQACGGRIARSGLLNSSTRRGCRVARRVCSTC
jgi:CRISPR-associated endonuclease Cas3-HD